MSLYPKAIILVTAVAFLTLPAHAEPDQKAQAVFKRLMTATLANDYDSFIAECDAGMKAALTKPMLTGVSKSIEAQAKKGYDSLYLGELSQQGHLVHLWRLRFKGGGDDVLATLSVKDGKAAGFYLK